MESRITERRGIDDLSAGVLRVAACLREGEGGSPTAVVTDADGLPDTELARIPPRMGVSHAAVITSAGGSAGDPTGARVVRFFTSQGELPSCGHATVAAIAVLALRAEGSGLGGVVRVAGRDVEATGRLTHPPGLVEAWFGQGVVLQRAAKPNERDAFLSALGLEGSDLDPDDAVSVASPGRERLLIPVTDRAVLADLRPDQGLLAEYSRLFGQLGCFVYVPPSPGGRAAGRMFAPVIGVPEDVANANSSGCLAAHLLVTGRGSTVAVDQGDALGRPSTVYATATRAAGGIATRVGGTARLLPTGGVRGVGGSGSSRRSP